jgi:NAD(P)-dependent dehydrogenase (short-subunit alcohol dehydrogenase family)
VIGFDGQAAIVTGAGRGLGRAYALDLGRRGAQVIVNDIGSSVTGEGADRGVADEVVDEIRAAGGTAVASYDSVATPEGGAAVVQAALDSFGRLDAVVSNAGIYETCPYDELPLERWRRMLQVHLDGAFHVTQPAFRAMKAQGYGRIVMIASNLGAFGLAENNHYGAAKGGIIGLTHNLALEAEPHGIFVNAVLPIGQTRMMMSSVDEADLHPIQRASFDRSSADRVVPMVTYLASRDCTVNHQLFSAAGGRYARVFLGLCEGWMADADSSPTAEDVAAHLDEISDTSCFTVPGGVADEMAELVQRYGLV